jgi:hypothetical protein
MHLKMIFNKAILLCKRWLENLVLFAWFKDIVREVFIARRAEEPRAATNFSISTTAAAWWPKFPVACALSVMLVPGSDSEVSCL